MLSAKKIAVSLVVALSTAFGLSAQNLDSLWVEKVNDSLLVIYPESIDSVALADTVAAVDTIAPLPVIVDSVIVEIPADADTVEFIEHVEPIVPRMSVEDSLLLVMEKVDSLIDLARINSDSDRYDFEEALNCYRQAEEICPAEQADAISVIDLGIKQCSFALEHTRQVYELDVVARATCSINDFVLFYPLPDSTWRVVPDRPALYYTGTEDVLHINRGGYMDWIYKMDASDSRIYFSSKELEGFGGYDLFYSDWNEELGEYDEPVNLGFPYNSPADDFLYITTEDGEYEIFSSNRDCDDDEVHIYVVRKGFEPVLVKAKKEKLIKMAQLEPALNDEATLGDMTDESNLRVDGAWKFIKHSYGKPVRVFFDED